MEQTKKCPACSEEILFTAKKCKFCSERFDGVKTPVTGLSESKILQVAPSDENALIRCQECFGWSLLGSQEMVVEGDSEVKLDWSERPVKTTKIQKYVKSHFSRSLDIPNLDKLRNLEAQFHSTEVLAPEEMGCGVLLIIVGILGAFTNISYGNVAGALGMGGLFSAIGILWLLVGGKHNEQIEKALEKRRVLLKEAKVLLGK